MRIGILAPPWTPVPPTSYGGIELVVDQLARGFAAAGHDVLLYASGDSTCPVPRASVLAEAEGQRIGMAVPELRHVLHGYEALQGMDIVHDHTVFGPIYSERFPDLPVVTTNHGPFNDELRDVYRFLGRRVPLIAISHAQRATAPDVHVARVIHHGLNAADFPFGAGDGGYCLFLGRMSPEKGAHRASEAAFKARVPLVIAAKMREPWERRYFDEFVAPYLNDEIRFVGEATADERIRLLAGASCLLVPIRWDEPFGMVMIEALACGTPVLAFAQGSAPEIVQDGQTGFLCHDVNDMAESIPKAARLDRAACRAAVEGYFSSERMVAEHLDLYERIVGR